MTKNLLKKKLKIVKTCQNELKKLKMTKKLLKKLKAFCQKVKIGTLKTIPILSSTLIDLTPKFSTLLIL